MPDARLDLELHLRGPVLSRATAAGQFGVDAPMVRDHTGRLALPATLIEGKLLEAWRQLRDLDDKTFDVPVEDWLGTTSDQAAGSYAPHRRRILFRDLTVRDDRPRPGMRVRISIDDSRGAADEGMLQVLETPFTAGEQAVFVGQVELLARDDAEAREMAQAVRVGLAWIVQLGALRTEGFGRLLGAAVTLVQGSAFPCAATADAEGRIGVVLTPQQPFCIARPRVGDGNVFESDDVIPGGAVKGAIARQWLARLPGPARGDVRADTDARCADLCRNFSRVRITHFFPGAARNRRAMAVPLSMVTAAGRLHDVALDDGPRLIGGEAPAFQPDWKAPEHADANVLFGRVSPARELRVRTAMDSDRRRAADKMLFAYEQVLPADHVWLGWIDLHDVPEKDRDAVARQLSEVIGGRLVGLGKTEAAAAIEIIGAADIAPACAPSSGAQPVRPWIVTLQTPALLTHAGALAETSGAAELHKAYADAWRDLSRGRLQLVRFFARQSLAGGVYLHGQFGHGRPYRPFVLTEPGSVFVLEASPGMDAKAAAWLQHAGLHGLPEPVPILRSYGVADGEDAWRHCPYLPANGYGEIAVNLDVHDTLHPGAAVDEATGRIDGRI